MTVGGFWWRGQDLRLFDQQDLMLFDQQDLWLFDRQSLGISIHHGCHRLTDHMWLEKTTWQLARTCSQLFPACQIVFLELLTVTSQIDTLDFGLEIEKEQTKLATQTACVT